MKNLIPLELHSIAINEGVMSEIHIMAQEARNVKEFIKEFMAEYGDKVKDNAETRKWLESMYNDTINEKSKGLWANIHAKRKKGKKPARKGSKAYKKAKAAADKLNNESVDLDIDSLNSKELKEISVSIENFKLLSRNEQDLFLKNYSAILPSNVVSILKSYRVDEAFIGPFVFNDKMSDEELKAMYQGALDGYANHSKGFEHPKSKYKQAYQAIEKILKKRGVSVDESVNEKLNLSDLKYQIPLSIENTLGFNPKSFKGIKKEGKKFRLSLSSYFGANSLKTVLDDVNSVLGIDLKILEGPHKGSNSIYFIGESLNEKKAPFEYNLGYKGQRGEKPYWKYAQVIGDKLKNIEGIRDYHKQQARGGRTAVQDISSRILIGTYGQPDIKDDIIRALKGVDPNLDLKTIKNNYDASDYSRSKNDQDKDKWEWEIQKKEDFHSWERKYGGKPKQDREFTHDHQMEFIDMLAPYSTTQHQLADIQITSLEDFLQYAADHVSAANLKKVTKRIKKEYPKLESVQIDSNDSGLNESERPRFKKRDRIQYRLTYKGGVGKYADAISQSDNIEVGVIAKRTRGIAGFKYTLTNGIELSDHEIIGLAESVNEGRKPITKKHWDKADDDQKEEWLLQAFSDPDDAMEYVELDWNDLPPQATSNMYESVSEIASPYELDAEAFTVELEKAKILADNIEVVGGPSRWARPGELRFRDHITLRTADNPMELYIIPTGKETYELYTDKSYSTGREIKKGDAKTIIKAMKRYVNKMNESVNEGKMPERYVGLDDIVYVKVKEDSRGANYKLYWRGHDVEVGGRRFASEKELESFAADYILSNQVYNKLKYKKPQAIPESKHILTLESFLNEALPTQEIDPDKFPHQWKKDKQFFRQGYKDGSNVDDTVETRPVKIPASQLKPSQDAVYLGKALGMAIGGVEGGSLDAIISQDNRILDGHHRWAATIFNNPKARVGGVQAQLKIGDLIPVLRQAGDALGNNRGLPPKGGDVNIFKATLQDVRDAVYDGKHMNPQFYNREQAVEWFERTGEKKIQNSLNILQRVGPPAGAPPRAEMPRVTPDQVKNVANKLAGGAIDVRKPYVGDPKVKNVGGLQNYLK